MTDKKHFTPWYFINFSLMEYSKSSLLQKRIVSSLNKGSAQKNFVLWGQHPPVFTLGRHGGIKNLKVSESFLKEKGVQLFSSERGGDITYHGPGQLVVYPVFPLHRKRLDVRQYVHNLEEVMIQTAAEFKIEIKRNRKNRGVWCENRKLGSVGIAIRRGISFHGFSMNVNLSLEPFRWINPCGMEGVAVTSMEKETRNRVNEKDVQKLLQKYFAAVFHIDPIYSSLSQLEELLTPPSGLVPNFKIG